MLNFVKTDQTFVIVEKENVILGEGQLINMKMGN